MLEPTKQQYEEAEMLALREARQEVKANGGEFGNYSGVIGKMSNFLRIAGEKKNAITNELYREHIPEKVFGVSSDEVADSLGMSETELMAKITPENIATHERTYTSLKVRRERITYLSSLDYELKKLVEEWRQKIREGIAIYNMKEIPKATPELINTYYDYLMAKAVARGKEYKLLKLKSELNLLLNPREEYTDIWTLLLKK